MDEKRFLYEDHVRNEWIDYNGHMNDASYAQVFSLALDQWINVIGLHEDARKKYGYTIFTLETHLCYLQEAHENQKLAITLQLLDEDEKRLHVICLMKNQEGDLIATSEQMLMGIDTTMNKPSPFPKEVIEKIQLFIDERDKLAVPIQAGRKIGIKRKGR